MCANPVQSMPCMDLLWAAISLGTAAFVVSQDMKQALFGTYYYYVWACHISQYLDFLSLLRTLPGTFHLDILFARTYTTCTVCAAQIYVVTFVVQGIEFVCCIALVRVGVLALCLPLSRRESYIVLAPDLDGQSCMCGQDGQDANCCRTGCVLAISGEGSSHSSTQCYHVGRSLL